MDQENLVECFYYNAPNLQDKALELAEELLAHKSNYFGYTKTHIERGIQQGDLAIYIIEDGELDCTFMTRVNTLETGVKELLIIAIKGKGVFKHGKKLLNLWIEIAKHCGCQFIWTQTSDPAVERILQKFRFMPISQTFVFSVPQGKTQ